MKSTTSAVLPFHPAFPTKFEFLGPCVTPYSGRSVPSGAKDIEVFAGMTRREWFMAHAPVEPPEWFNPVMRDCPAVPSIHSITDPSLRAGVEAYWESETDDPEAIAWIEAEKAAGLAQAQWQIDFRRELSLQWPGYWADEMLKRSGA